jgi:transcription-repair coupling factor (superfamily II helicase)
VLNDLEEAGYFYQDCCELLGEEAVLFFPSAFRRSIRYGQRDAANEILRTEALGQLSGGGGRRMVVTYPDALAERVVSVDRLRRDTLELGVGERVDRGFVEDLLGSYGFEWVDYVYEPGQFAIRGSIIDVFSYADEFPYRVDFFGDVVESIRRFDVDTQLSRDRLERVSIVAMQGEEGEVSVFSYLPKGSVAVIGSEDWLYERVGALWDEGPVVGQGETFASLEEVRRWLVPEAEVRGSMAGLRRLYLSGGGGNGVRFETEPQESYHKNFERVAASFRERMKDGYRVFVLTRNEKQVQRLRSIFEDRGDAVAFEPVMIELHGGFVDRERRVCLFTDHQLFDRYHKYRLKSERARSGKIALSLKELQEFRHGDYLVHLDHGIGRFGGLIRTEMNGRWQEVIKMTFSGEDMIFVSIHNLHKIAKYRGKDGEPPRLSKLGSGAWESLKARTKKKVKDIAKDLILLYSRRWEEKGFAFSGDTYLQRELEASFIYEDTPDQLKATREVKEDMERQRPMDRLVCGDVGFGKTEVAIRAAFKAVVDGKQVAVLVPTTLLAFQHYRSFKERLADFPVSVDYLSRARSPGMTKEMLGRLGEGKVDILIGTHRLIGKDVRFKDLGLLIVDEEQKFGVSVKEKLKQLKVNVDTLTLTATPIPRTLQFSLMGARDLSNISTPPPNRYPIHTEVHRFGGEIIREAVNFEMSRGGQVFIINNRIANLQDLADLVVREVPDARVALAHGRMDPRALEEVILDFANYEYDVLVATAIVENGIDIPNVNTIIVNGAHHFGLSDLHQLRGRVGRSNSKAFCYLLSPPLSEVTPEARRRLQAIESFSELGSGIHIAMQDLDIRGAGNMLGAEQSGFIADLGYETYQKILAEAVQELKNEEFADLYREEEVDSGEGYVRETNVESDLELLFPATYIPSDSERILLYRELDGMEDEAGIDRFRAKLLDRFGPVPDRGEELIRVVRLRRKAKRLGVDKIVLKSGSMTVYLVADPDSPYYRSVAFDKLLEFAKKNSKVCRLSEKRNRRLLSVQDVGTVERAVQVIDEIAGQ